MATRPRFGVLVLQDSPWPAIVERVRRYEALGFDTVWVADHFVNPFAPSAPWFESWTLLAGLAARTDRVRLGPLISHLVYRNPALLAREAMTVDHIAGGRLELGLGAGASGYDPPMTGGVWWEPAERLARFREGVEIVDRLLREEAATYEGRYYRVHGATLRPGPLQRPRPRLTIAASGPKLIDLAARYADAWNTEGGFAELYERRATPADVHRMARERGELLSERAAAHGRDPASVTRSFLFGFGPAPEDPWASVEGCHDLVGRYRAIGFGEFVFPEPTAADHAVFERVAQDIVQPGGGPPASAASR